MSRLLAILGAALTVAVPALAADQGEHHGPTIRELLWQAANLALLLAVLFFAARKPVQAFFADRRDNIQGDITSASELLKQTESNFSEWQRKVVDLETELSEIRETASRRAQEERERILGEARAAAERIKNDATAAIDQELRRAKQDLAREASDLALELATNLLRQQVSESDRDRLIDEFISSVERSAGPNDSSLSDSGR